MKYGCDNCDHCAICCKGWDIELSKEDIMAIASLGYELKYFLNVKPLPRMKVVGKEKNCIFLDSENMCVLEKSHGHSAKPHTCRHYPKITPEKLKEKDYFFFGYGGKTFSRDVFAHVLGTLDDVAPSDLFNVLLFRLEKLRKHRAKYIDIFNYDERRRHSDLSKALARSRIRKLTRSRFGKEDAEEFSGIKTAKKFNVARFIDHLKKGVCKECSLNPNLPDMLLAYLLVLKKEQPKDAKEAADYFFEWNAKRF